MSEKPSQKLPKSEKRHRKCLVEWCQNPASSPRNRYCSIHGYGKQCQIPGCTKKASRNYSLCYRHYEHLGETFKRPSPKDERFWSHVKTGSKNECWEWGSCINSWGYGLFWDGESSIIAHKYVYESMHGLTSTRIYHTCTNRKCCNPDHLTLENPRKKK